MNISEYTSSLMHFHTFFLYFVENFYVDQIKVNRAKVITLDCIDSMSLGIHRNHASIFYLTRQISTFWSSSSYRYSTFSRIESQLIICKYLFWSKISIIFNFSISFQIAYANIKPVVVIIVVSILHDIKCYLHGTK